jgi:hypothetical protein
MSIDYRCDVILGVRVGLSHSNPNFSKAEFRLYIPIYRINDY